MIGPFILEGRLTGEAYLRFLQEELSRLLEDVPLNKRSRMNFQHDGAPPILHGKLEISWTIVSLGDWSDVAVRTIGPRGSRLKPTGLLCMGMDERTGLQCEVGNARCIAWSHCECRRPHQNQSAEAATSNSRTSQPSGSQCCGRRCHFRKPDLSRDQLILQAFSWS